MSKIKNDIHVRMTSLKDLETLQKLHEKHGISRNILVQQCIKIALPQLENQLEQGTVLDASFTSTRVSEASNNTKILDEKLEKTLENLRDNSILNLANLQTNSEILFLLKLIFEKTHGSIPLHDFGKYDKEIIKYLKEKMS